MAVELLGGHGDDLWPPPGRVFAVGTSHTFEHLADAVNGAFARWDRSHLSMFTLADGRVVTDEETGVELTASAFGPVVTSLDMTTTKISQLLHPGAEFKFTFDFGDDWTHRCVIADEKIDPLEVLGIRPNVPLSYWGWGDIPDQYARRWESDDGESPAPSRPSRPHPMRHHSWPSQEQAAEVDLPELLQAIAAQDADRFLAAVAGHDVDDALQQVGAGISMALEQKREKSEPVALSIINRLMMRAGEGDQVLADDLLALLRGESALGRVVPIDLGMLSVMLEGDPSFSAGTYVDLRTGDVYSDNDTGRAMVGEDAIDVEDDPDRWLWRDGIDSHAGWRDMEAFAERERDATLRDRLMRAIEGKGAFRRFRDLVHDEALADQWRIFSEDREIGRARQMLADVGIRVG